MQFFTNEKEIRYYTTTIFCCETDSSFFPFCNVFVNAERNAFARAADLDSELEFSITDDTNKKIFFSSFILYTFIQNIYCHSCYIYIFGIYTTKFIYFNFLHVFRPVPIFLFHFGVFIDKIFFFSFLFSFKCKFFHVLYGQKFSLLSYSEEEVKNFHCEAFFNRKNSIVLTLHFNLEFKMVSLGGFEICLH